MSSHTHFEYAYLHALRDILETGERRESRNATTISKFSVKLDFNIREHFPLLTTKQMYWKGIAHELLWFLRADTNSKHLEEKKVNIWKPNSSREYLDSIGLQHYPEGTCGPIYGFQWRHFGATYQGADTDYTTQADQGVDQLAECIRQIREDPHSRRIFMSAWNPTQLKEMCLPPCHVSYQFYVNASDELSCMMYQRSGDMFLGIPFNIASVALLTHIIANITEKKVGSISIVIGDAHIYESHVDAVKLQLSREPKAPCKLHIITDVDRIRKNPEDFEFDDFSLVDYECYPTIKAEMVA
jgi:thymidylate synthase